MVVNALGKKKKKKELERETRSARVEQERQVSVSNGLPREDRREMTSTETGWRGERGRSGTFKGKSTAGIQSN